jgi:CBS domain containing-hemolysin-like protein
MLKAHSQKSRMDRALIHLLNKPNDTLTTILVLNNLTNVSLSLTAGAIAESYFHTFSAGPLALAAFGATAFILVFGEVVPKCLAHVKAPQLSRVVAWPIAVASLVLLPVRAPMNAVIGWAFHMMGASDHEAADRISEEELKILMNSGVVSTLLEEDEREMIHGVFELGDTYVEQIMVPRAEVTCLPDDLDQAEMLERLREINHKRVLIYHENQEQLTGFVLVKEVLLHPDRPWRESLRELLCVPGRVRLFDLLKRFRRESTKIAAIVDEYGGMAGIVTLRDILEEIIGDMAERHEPRIPDLRRVGQDRWQVRGQMKLSDLGRELMVDFPDDRGSTVGGFVMNMLGHVPSDGAAIRFNGLTLTVMHMMGRRIMQLEVVRESSKSAAPSAPPAGGNGS